MTETTIHTDEQARDTLDRAAGGMRAVGYYVTAQNGKRHFALLGPYATRAGAGANVGRANAYACEHLAAQGAGFWGYGCTRAVAKPGRELPTGQLNDVLGLYVPAPPGTAA